MPHLPCASRIALQTRSGVAGLPTSVTPRCETASTIALTTAGGAAIVPASPIPLTPSGFVGDGVTVRSSSNAGISTAEGTRYWVSVPVTRLPCSSYRISSYSASAIPNATPPCTCPSTIIGFITTPQSSTATYRSSWVAPVSVSTSATQTWVPNGQVKFFGSQVAIAVRSGS